MVHLVYQTIPNIPKKRKRRRRIKKLEVGCNWGQKTVDVLAARSMFDGFVGKNTEALTQMVANNRLIAEYSKACRDELKYGCVFAE